jgi:hypothetical protein
VDDLVKRAAFEYELEARHDARRAVWAVFTTAPHRFLLPPKASGLIPSKKPTALQESPNAGPPRSSATISECRLPRNNTPQRQVASLRVVANCSPGYAAEQHPQLSLLVAPALAAGRFLYESTRSRRRRNQQGPFLPPLICRPGSQVPSHDAQHELRSVATK